MRNKHIWKIILFFLIMYISTAGELVETFARTGQELGLAYLIAFVDLLPSTGAMMAIPFLCRIIRKKKLANKGGKILCLLNSVLLFLVPIILFNYTLIGGIGAIFFYFINKWIFVDSPSAHNNNDSYYLEDDPNRITQCKSCGYQNKDYFNACPKCGKYAKRYVYLNENSSADKNNTEDTNLPDLDIDKMNSQEAAEYLVAEQINKMQEQKNQETCNKNVVRHCTHCGKKLAANSNFCGYCGTQVYQKNQNN